MTLGDKTNSKRKLAYSSALVLAFAASPVAIGCGGDDTVVVETPDTGAPDTGALDTGAPDTGSPDTGTLDTGMVDTGPEAPTDPTATPAFDPPGGPYMAPQSVKITSTTPGAVIYYTTDGTKPNVSSPKYAAPINVTKTTTIQAMALAPGFIQSEVATATYTISILEGTVVPVEFTPAAGPYENDQTVALTSATAAATICYTLDGSAPTCDEAAAKCSGSSATYSGSTPVLINTTGRTIKAVGCKVGMKTSAVTSASYTLNAASAKFSPAPGTYDTAITLTATLATAGATVRFTTDGTNPDCTTIGAPFVSGTSPGTLSTNTVVKTITCKPGYNPSPVQTLDYKFRAAAPTVSPASGERNNQTAVTITNAAGSAAGTISCYSTDPTKAPSCNTASPATCGGGALLYTTPFNVDKNTSVTAVSCSPGTVQSANATATYTFQVAKPTLTPVTGTTWPFGGTIDTGTATTTTGTGATANNVQVYWTIDLAAPNCATPPSGTACRPGAVAGDTCTCGVGVASCSIPKTGMVAGSTVNVIACKTGYASSEVTSATYPPVGTLANPTIAPSGGTWTNNTGTNLNADTDFTDSDETPPLTITQGGPTDATICYVVTTTTTTPDPDCDAAAACTSGTKYNAATPPVVNTTGSFVKARVCKAGSTKSGVTTSGVFTFNVAEPITATESHTFGSGGSDGWPYGATVTFDTATVGEEFHYFTENFWSGGSTEPSCSTGTVSSVYTIIKPFVGEYIAIRGCKTGYNATSTSVYGPYFSAGLASPTYSPAPTPSPNGDITNVPTVKMASVSKAAPGFKICWTSDNSTPGCNAAKVCQCSGVAGCVVNTAADGATWTPTATGQTIRAMTCANGETNSPVSFSTYNFRTSTPTFTPVSIAYSAATNYAVGAFVQSGNTTYKALKANGPSTAVVAPAADPTTWEAQSSLTVTIGLDPNDTAGGKTTGSKLCWRLNAAPTFKAVDATATPPVVDCTPNDTETKCNDGGAGVPADATVTMTSTTTIFATSCRAGFAKSSNSAAYNIAPRWFSPNMTSPVNDFPADSAFSTSTTGETAYMTWDQDYVYLGYSGASLTGSNQFHAYFNGSASDTTVTASPETGYGTTALPFANATWHFHYRADGLDTAIQNWNGTGWGASSVGTLVISGGSTSGFVKIRLNRTDLGFGFSSATDPMIRATGAIWNGTANVGGFPGGVFTKYIESSLKDSRAFNNTAHIKP